MKLLLSWFVLVKTRCNFLTKMKFSFEVFYAFELTLAR